MIESLPSFLTELFPYTSVYVLQSMVNQVPSTMGGPGGGYEKYRPSYGGSRDPKESYGGGPRGIGGGSKRETGGTIDVIGANSNSRRPPQGPPPPLDDSGPPPPVSRQISQKYYDMNPIYIF